MTTGMTMPQGYIFKTHQTLLSSTPPLFESFTWLSQSANVEKMLAGEGAEIVVACDGSQSRRGVPKGAIVLSERKGGLWVLLIPGAGGWQKPYSANAREKNIDAKAEAMLARDLARSAAASDSAEDRV